MRNKIVSLDSIFPTMMFTLIWVLRIGLLTCNLFLVFSKHDRIQTRCVFTLLRNMSNRWRNITRLENICWSLWKHGISFETVSSIEGRYISTSNSCVECSCVIWYVNVYPLSSVRYPICLFRVTQIRFV